MAFTFRPESGPTTVVHQGQVPAGGIVTVGGRPFLPSSVEEALKRNYPNLRIEWLEAAWGMSGYVIKERWPADSPKWREVQEGRRNPDHCYDIVHRFPPETRTDDMVGFIENRMRVVTDPKKEAERLIERAKKLLADTQNEGVEKLVEQSTQRILDESDHLRQVRAGAASAHPMVPGADFSDSPKRLL